MIPSMMPDGKARISMANIRPTKRPHSECWRLDHSKAMSWWGQPGDVRRCPHGKIQLRTQVSVDAPVQGPGTDWWRTLSPIWDPFTYRRAKRALEPIEPNGDG